MRDLALLLVFGWPELFSASVKVHLEPSFDLPHLTNTNGESTVR